MNSLQKPLRDGQGRSFPYLRLSLTDLCNFRCSYCLPDGCEEHHHESTLSLTEIKRLVSAFSVLGVEKIRLTGGEPTLRSDFRDIVEVIKAVPGIRRVAMTTNGYKMDRRVESWMDAGIDNINISVDSLDPRAFELITGHNRLQEILEGMDKAFAKGLPEIKVNAVLMKGVNDVQLPEFLDWIKHKPITMRFIELMQTGDNGAFFDKYHVAGKTIRDQLLENGWVRMTRLKDAGPAHEYCHPDYEGRIGLITPYSKDFCKDCNRLRVTSQGQLQLCLFAESGHDLRHLLQSDDQQDELIAEIQKVLRLKVDGHFLDQGYTGNTASLAQIGG